MIKFNKILILTALLVLPALLQAQQGGVTQNPENLNLKGVDAGTRKDFTRAHELFDQAIGIYNYSSAKTLHNMGWVCEQNNNIQTAIFYYKEAALRNPLQKNTHERLGFLYYTTGDYDRAVIEGELSLKYTPDNPEVLQWLPDAYARRLALKKKNIDEKISEQKREENTKAVQERKEDGAEREFYISGGFDFTIKAVWDRAESKMIFGETNSLFLPFPWNFYLQSNFVKNWEFRFELFTPYLGAIAPAVCAQTEKLEILYHFFNYQLGVGFLFNHYDSEWAFGSAESFSDFKLGLLFHKGTNFTDLDIKFYPRLIPYDSGLAPGKSYDTDMLDINFGFFIKDILKIYGGFLAQDYYLFDHDLVISDYAGIYDFSIGMIFTQKISSKVLNEIKYNICYKQKLYLENKNNSRPYSLLNGQGFFGLDAYNWYKGAPLSGFRTTSEELSFRIDEKINKNLSLYQKISFEYTTPSQPFNDLSFNIGISGGY